MSTKQIQRLFAGFLTSIVFSTVGCFAENVGPEGGEAEEATSEASEALKPAGEYSCGNLAKCYKDGVQCGCASASGQCNWPECK